jgi:hypothetical protein
MEITFFLFQFLKSWWWLFFSLISYFFARFFYFWWINWEIFYKRNFEWILLEIKPPKEVLKPFSAMEAVFSTLWGIWDGPNWKQRWCQGGLVLGYGGWFSIEICSFGGEIHFYLRIPSHFKSTAEAAIYAQYPEVEIFEVEDYTQKVSQNIPNEKFDLYSEDFAFVRPDHFPIKTYSMFLERPEEEKRVMEEKRLDPLNQLLEGLSKLTPKEQLWIQIVCNPIVEDTFPWAEGGKREIEKITKRKTSPPPKSFFKELIDFLISFPAEMIRTLFSTPLSKPKKEEKLELFAPELRLTPAERETLMAIENKLKKNSFECWIRQVYIYKKGYNFGNYSVLRSYLTFPFSAEHLNRIVFFGATRTKIHYWFKQRRLYLRKRQRLRDYIERLPSYFPWNLVGEPPLFIRFLTLFGYRIPPGKRSVMVLNTEELATIFHFPVRIYIPTVPRVEAKRVGPPPTLPRE